MVLPPAVFGLLGILGLGGQIAVSYYRRPSWLSEDEALESNWNRINLYSGLTGLSFGLLATVLALVNGEHGQSIAFAMVGGYVLFQSIFTDMRLRYVDRWIMRFANLVAVIAGVLILSEFGSSSDWVFYLVFTIAAFATGYLPGIGESDGRAFAFLVLASYPVAATNGVKWSIILMIASIFVYFIAHSIWKKNLSFSGIFTKVSFPMVPLIIFPVLIVILFGQQLPIL